MKLCVFPNDPIIAYYEKGEIKPRYFNPCNLFDEVHIISFTEKDIDESLVQSIAGNARLKIYNVGRIDIKNRVKNIKQIIDRVKTINPDVIRAYNPLVQGWIAARCSEELGIPLFVSLHIQYDGLGKLYRKYFIKRYFGLKYTEKFIEPYVIRKADKITIVYKIIEPYVIKNKGTTPELLYNSIDFNRFNSGIALENLPKPLIISVGRLTKQKNHECLIRAMKKIDASLLIIGNGELYNKLEKLVRELELNSRIIIKKSVPNSEIQNYYKSAELFALAYDPALEGLPIPVIEAMASGLPVVIPCPRENLSDGLETIAVFAERDPDSFARKINEILKNSDLRKELSNKSLKKAKEFDNNVIEKREAEIYYELLKRE